MWLVKSTVHHFEESDDEVWMFLILVLFHSVLIEFLARGAGV